MADCRQEHEQKGGTKQKETICHGIYLPGVIRSHNKSTGIQSEILASCGRKVNRKQENIEGECPVVNAMGSLSRRPGYASPIRIPIFFSSSGTKILVAEIVWIWLPLPALSAGVIAFRNMKKSRLSS
jgi:hypothetical protein